MTKRKKANANNPAAAETSHADPRSGAPATAVASFDDLLVNLEARKDRAKHTEHADATGHQEPTAERREEPVIAVEDQVVAQHLHLRGLLEALIFASDTPITPKDLAQLASAPVSRVRELVDELRQDYATRGFHLDEVAGGLLFRTSAQYAPFIRDLTQDKPVRLSRAQVETLAIIAYRQPITRPEIDDVRGVDSGPVLKMLLERDLVRILGKRDEPGRPLIYGTTNAFLEFFGLKSLKDLPTLREFTELTDESRQAYEDELGEPPNDFTLGAGVALETEEETAEESDDANADAVATREDAPAMASEAPTGVMVPSDSEPIEEPIAPIDEDELDRLGREALEELEDFQDDEPLAEDDDTSEHDLDDDRE